MHWGLSFKSQLEVTPALLPGRTLPLLPPPVHACLSPRPDLPAGQSCWKRGWQRLGGRTGWPAQCREHRQPAHRLGGACMQGKANATGSLGKACKGVAGWMLGALPAMLSLTTTSHPQPYLLFCTRVRPIQPAAASGSRLATSCAGRAAPPAKQRSVPSSQRQRKPSPAPLHAACTAAASGRRAVLSWLSEDNSCHAALRQQDSNRQRAQPWYKTARSKRRIKPWHHS